MERLRPVYETGVLRLLLRGNSMLYVALLRSTFDPLTGELPREIVEERFSRSLTRLAETGDYTPKEGQTSAEAAHTILQQLTKEGEGDYAWLANSLDVAAHRYLYRLTARAHRAIEALDRLEDTTKALSGAQANSIIMEIEHARMQLTADPRERIRLLERDIEERQKQIDELKHSDTLDKLYEGIEDVRRQIRISDEAVSRLVRQQTDTHYRTMLDKLHRLFVRASDDAKTHPGSDERPYRTDTGTAQFQALPSRPAKSMARAATAGLDDAPSTNVDAPDLKAMVEMCGPRLTHMIGLIRRDPVKTADGRFVDFAASFNRLPREERRESELIGFLSALRTQDGPATVAWHCVSIDGGERVWRTRPILTTEAALDEIIEEG